MNPKISDLVFFGFWSCPHWVFSRYHPTRVLTLIYQPFALAPHAILAYHEAKLDRRNRKDGYALFVLSSLLVIAADVATSGKGGIGDFIVICTIAGAFGVADAHIQGGMIGDLSLMCPKFIQVGHWQMASYLLFLNFLYALLLTAAYNLWAS
ncbi:equilibrative nucleotide transporter 3-like [Phoenix dactylifera]|uniref:Equilibrative nucleotide transporter 3-like n=1 Tax=Phoenix dactylifera TaxID=42345 RepID=A0A8B8ZIB3_PHODC|nr:equilibrative nucleotide transporter 3-like [Phoenix dactylifera]